MRYHEKFLSIHPISNISVCATLGKKETRKQTGKRVVRKYSGGCAGAAGAARAAAAGTVAGAVVGAGVAGVDVGAAAGDFVIIIDGASVVVGVVVIGDAVAAATTGAVTVGTAISWALPGFRIGFRQLCLQGQRLLSLLLSYCSKSQYNID